MKTTIQKLEELGIEIKYVDPEEAIQSVRKMHEEICNQQKETQKMKCDRCGNTNPIIGDSFRIMPKKKKGMPFETLHFDAIDYLQYNPEIDNYEYKTICYDCLKSLFDQKNLLLAGYDVYSDTPPYKTGRSEFISQNIFKRIFEYIKEKYEKICNAGSAC